MSHLLLCVHHIDLDDKGDICLLGKEICLDASLPEATFAGVVLGSLSSVEEFQSRLTGKSAGARAPGR